MENFDEYQDLIDQYLEGTLPDEERQLFEMQLANNDDLAAHAEIIRLVKNEVIERAEFNEIIKKGEKKKAIRKYLYSASIAASLLILFYIAFWQPGKLSNKEFINQYSLADNDVLYNKKMYDSELVENNNYMRSLRNDFFVGDSSIKIKEAVSLFHEGRYKEASLLFEQNIKSKSSDLRVTFMLAYSLYASDQLNKAQEYLVYLSKARDLETSNRSLLLLALVEVKRGNNFEARKILRNLKSQNTEVSATAANMLQKLRWF